VKHLWYSSCPPRKDDSSRHLAALTICRTVPLCSHTGSYLPRSGPNRSQESSERCTDRSRRANAEERGANRASGFRFSVPGSSFVHDHLGPHLHSMLPQGPASFPDGAQALLRYPRDKLTFTEIVQLRNGVYIKRLFQNLHF
jgi:hypothetical protein